MKGLIIGIILGLVIGFVWNHYSVDTKKLSDGVTGSVSTKSP